jgi:hypothetical protein
VCRRFAAAVMLAVALCGGTGFAQEELPQIIPGEHKIPVKKDNGPRALALLQLGKDGKAALVPIAIMINGKFWDASAYKADPVPMALDSGTVYEAERSGSSQGLFTVAGALHSNAVNTQAPWLGTGSWVPTGKEKPSTALKAETAPRGIDTVDAPPRLTRNPAPASSSPPPPANNAPASPPPASSPNSGDGPPRLTRPASSAPANAPSSTPASAPGDSKGGTPGSSQPGSSQPGSTQSGSIQPVAASTAPPQKNKPAAPASIPASDSGTPEADRPRLRRGKPAESFADEDIPGYSKPGEAPSAAKSETAGQTKPAAPAPAELVPAISDAGGPEPRSYAFEWLKDEESHRRQQMTDLAKQQLLSYLQKEAKEEISAAPPARHGKTRVAEKKVPEPVLENVKMSAFDLWNTNQPILVLSAEIHLPSHSSETGFDQTRQFWITLTAYPDIYGNLRKIYAGVTDKYHLDVTPRLELIDAVDADGDGRGELLFRETSDAGTGWIIYRATADTLWKMYDSLNPE